LINEKNSLRVAALLLKAPVTEEVMVAEPGFSTPRMTMHICLWEGGRERERGE
jgi:hypothetical protein